MTPEQREELKAAALAADKKGQHIYTNPRDSNNWDNNAMWHAMAGPETVLSLIAQVEALTVPQVAVSVERGGVYIIKGVQSFRLAYEGETRGEQEWYAGVLRKALAAPTIPAIPGTKEGA